MQLVHPFFPSLRCWSGPSDGRYHIDFLGVKTDPKFAPGLAPSPVGAVEGAFPEPGPEIFEWITTVGAARNAKGKFVMAQIGGGWGAWLVRSGIAIRNRSKVPFHLVGVESDPLQFTWMREHFAANGINPDVHTLIRGALRRSEDVRNVKVVDLEVLSAGFEEIDVLYLDLQQGEYEEIESSMTALNKKVRRICIRTHQKNVDCELEQLFRKAGWLPRWIYHTGSIWSTYWGPMHFQTGCQVWLNEASARIVRKPPPSIATHGQATPAQSKAPSPVTVPLSTVQAEPDSSTVAEGTDPCPA